jgi:hypothetical protein
MTINHINKPALTTPVSLPRKTRGFAGIEPGRLHGGRVSMEVGPDPDDEIIDRVKTMDGKQMRLFLKVPANRAAYDQALKNKGIQI